MDFNKSGDTMASVSEDETLKIWHKNPDQSSKIVYLVD